MTDAFDAGRVLVIGEALIDIVDHGSGPVEHVGGSPLNVAVGLARLGVDVTFATEFARDDRGERIAAHLAREGVSVVRTAPAAGRTSTAHARLRSDGSAAYEFDLEWDLAQMPSAQGFGVVHVGSVGALRPPGADRVIELVESLPAGVLVTFDPNIRPALLPERERTRQLVERFAARAAVVKLSDEDAHWLYPGDTASAAIHLLNAGAAVVVITRGASGSEIHAHGRIVTVPVFRTAVADTIGAGDAYMSGVIAAIVRRPAAAAALRHGAAPDDLAEIGRIAAAAAGVTVSRAGAAPPTSSELVAASGVPWA